MKTGLVLLLIFDVFKLTRSELRHHQQDTYANENLTNYPSSSTTQYRIYDDRKFSEITGIKQQWTVTSSDENEQTGVVKPSSLVTLLKFSEKNLREPTEVVLKFEEDEQEEKSRKEIFFKLKNNFKKMGESVNNIVEFKNSTVEFPVKGSNSHFSSSSYNSERRSNKKGVFNVSNEIRSQQNNIIGEKTSNMNQMVAEKINSQHKDLIHNYVFFQRNVNREPLKTLNKFREIPNFSFAQPLVAFADVDEFDDCGENLLEDFAVSDYLVTRDVLANKNEAGKLTTVLVEKDGSLNEMTDVMKSAMKKNSKITSISVTVMKKDEKSKNSLTLYRKGNDLLINQQPREYPKFSNNMKSSWTPLFRSCLTKTWIFGYTSKAENEDQRIDVTLFFSVDQINGTIDQCNSSFRQILNGGPKCDLTTTKCEAVPYSGFKIGGYKCVCRNGFYFPNGYEIRDHYFKGSDIEKTYTNENSSRFRCLTCPDSCERSCSPSGYCMFQRNRLLKNSLLSIQIFCIFTSFTIIILVFKHRKCKTIATGMWTIMEMILLGSIILYSTIIIRAFSSSTILCLIEPWCREMGFVLCYGAIILKLYRILIEFRTRKAHRWVIRDKDLLKYLLGMIIVVFGYMSAWTATNLNLIKKENYSMLTMGVTEDGVYFQTCKAVWWDYVTETGEILILLFGIHLSYASRNATTQFRERCFLCISISLEALVSGIFYILRYFYWEGTMHPDLSFVANFTRCQLTTTLVLLLLFTPKWWYQKVKINKGRVSRNYLMQESGRGPLEAFKPQDGITATNSDVEGEISLADMNPEDIRAELKRLYTQLEVLKNKTIRFDNPHISKRRGGRKIAHRRFSLQKKGSKEKALRQQTQRLSTKHLDAEVTEAEASRTPEDSVCSNEGPSIIINDGPSDIIHMTPKKTQK